MAESASLDAAKLFRVDGLTAVITGGGTGLGYMMAKALALNGAHRVYIIGRRLDKLQAAADSLPKDIVVPLQGDVCSKDDLQALAARVQQDVGHINLLVCNAGVLGPLIYGLSPSASLKEFKDYCWNWSTGDFTKVYECNNTAVFFTALAFLELLHAGNEKGNMPGISSQILVNGSNGAFVRQVRTGFAYVSSKAGVVQLSKGLSTCFAPYGIRVNTLAPGLFPTEMTQEGLAMFMQTKTSGGPVFERSLLPAERAGNEEDMAGTILYVASRAGAYLNGSIVLLDGGRLSVMPASY